MGKRSCAVPGCKTGYKPRKKDSNVVREKHSLFKPKNTQQLEKWRKAIPQTNKEITIDDAVCDLHFNEEDIDRYYEVRISDGTTWKCKKGKASLKEDAVPVLFPGLPSYYNQITNKRKPPLERHLIPKEKIKDYGEKLKDNGNEMKHAEIKKDSMNKIKHAVIQKDMHKTRNIEIKKEKIRIDEIEKDMRKNRNEEIETSMYIVKEEEIEVNMAEDSEMFNFTSLVDNLQLISRPNALWGITAHSTFIMCAKWSVSYKLEKTVIVSSDLKVQVFLKDKHITAHDQIISNLSDLSSILQEVDNYVMCVGVEDVRKIGCDSFLPPKSKSQLCKSCQIIRKKAVDRSRKKELYGIKKRLKMCLDKMEEEDLMCESKEHID